MATVKRNCDNCNNEYQAKTADIKRGWGKCCSKSCSAKIREKNKPSYDIETVQRNNRIRSGNMTSKDFLSLPPNRRSYLLNVQKINVSIETFKQLTETEKIEYNLKRYDENAPNVYGGSGMIQGYTSEGYRIMDGVAYDEWDSPVYNVDPYEDGMDRSWKD